ncbi:hypothetical protein HGD90_02065 [Rhodobacteraceae bacterium R_SAG7]|jgi:hypothetical protein|nr:hypothetical protein [Rhodobacteraceae bacterium R_SAG7]
MKQLLVLFLSLCLAGGVKADERLRTYYGMKLAVAGIPVFVPQDPLVRFGQVEAAPKGTWRFNVMPVFGYDSNLNGGVPHDVVDINGLRFTVLEKDRAIGGLEAGVMARVRAEYYLAQGHRLSGALSARYTRALAHDLASQVATADACYHYDAPSWTFAQACVTAGLSKTELSKTQTETARISIGRVFDVGKFPKSFQLGLSKTNGNDADYTQVHANYNVNTARATYAIGLMTRIEGEGHSEDKSAYMQITNSMIGRPVSTVFRYSTSSGGGFLGLQRDERTASVTISVPLTDRLAFDLSYSDTRSPLQYFRKKTFGANFILTKF